MGMAGGIGVPPPPGTSPHIENIWFKDREIYLDNWTFTSCRFDNCRLHVYTPNFVLDRCYIGQDCTIYYMGNSARLVQLFNANNEHIRASMPFFAAKKNSDGTITIGA